VEPLLVDVSTELIMLESIYSVDGNGCWVGNFGVRYRGVRDCGPDGFFLCLENR